MSDDALFRDKLKHMGKCESVHRLRVGSGMPARAGGKLGAGQAEEEPAALLGARPSAAVVPAHAACPLRVLRARQPVHVRLPVRVRGVFLLPPLAAGHTRPHHPGSRTEGLAHRRAGRGPLYAAVARCAETVFSPSSVALGLSFRLYSTVLGCCIPALRWSPPGPRQQQGAPVPHAGTTDGRWRSGSWCPSSALSVCPRCMCGLWHESRMQVVVWNRGISGQFV